MKIKNKTHFVTWGLSFITLALINLFLGLKRGFDYYVVLSMTIMFSFGFDGIIRSMFDEDDNAREEELKANAAILFKVDNVSKYIFKVMLVLFFGGVYLFKDASWMTDSLINCGIFGMIMFNILTVIEFIANLYYINERENEEHIKHA